jgi:hypothetical protein
MQAVEQRKLNGVKSSQQRDHTRESVVHKVRSRSDTENTKTCAISLLGNRLRA